MTTTPKMNNGPTEPLPAAGSDRFVADSLAAEWAQALVADIRNLANLPVDWDDSGAAPFDPELLDAACDFIETLAGHMPGLCNLVPLANGNVQLEWREGSKILELEFESPQTIRYLQWYPELAVEEEDTFHLANINKAAELFKWFKSGTWA